MGKQKLMFKRVLASEDTVGNVLKAGCKVRQTLLFIAEEREIGILFQREIVFLLPVRERFEFHCRTTSASTAPRTPQGTCCPYAHVLINVPRVS